MAEQGEAGNAPITVRGPSQTSRARGLSEISWLGEEVSDSEQRAAPFSTAQLWGGETERAPGATGAMWRSQFLHRMAVTGSPEEP